MDDLKQGRSQDAELVAEMVELLRIITDNYAQYHAGQNHPDVVRARELLAKYENQK